ncbi:MAG TPA: ABC transporter permease subunit [Symbiobacteriaceae bacterium]|nr:ABC transporter permease subunit [Symbiobacteriaceae bacterium]
MAKRAALRIAVSAFLLPLLPLVLWAFAPAWPWPRLLPARLGMQAWQYLLSPGPGVLQAALTSAGLALLVTLACVAIGLPAGLALGRHTFPGRTAVEVLVLLPLLVPPMAWSVGVHYLFVRLGLTDSLAGVWLAHLVPALPYMVRTVGAAAATLGMRAEEVGRTLGAGPWQAFRLITLPRLVPALLAGSALTFLVSLSQYLLTLLIGGGAVSTLPVVLMPFLTGADRSLAAALSLVFCGVGALFLWLTELLLRRAAGRDRAPWLHL